MDTRINQYLVGDLMSGANFAQISKPIRDLLHSIVSNSETHGKYLNTLSYVEHLGARYLRLSNEDKDFTEPVLRHYLEEVRHAYIIRKMAEKVLKRSLVYTDSDMLVRSSANMYFARLAANVRSYCRNIN